MAHSGLITTIIPFLTSTMPPPLRIEPPATATIVLCPQSPPAPNIAMKLLPCTVAHAWKALKDWDWVKHVGG